MDGSEQPRRGRKPALESRSAELRQRIAEWKGVSYQQRKPITELARELGISHQLASHYASRVPSPDPITEAAAIVAENLPQIAEMVGRWDEIYKKVGEGRPLSRNDLRFLRKAAQAGNKKARALLRKLEGNANRS